MTSVDMTSRGDGSVEQLAGGQRPFARDNVVYLHQALDLIDALSDDDFIRTFPPMFENTIGAHLRHVIDHYSCFLDGLDSGRIDYDDRKRDVRLETGRSAAAQAIRTIIAKLDALNDQTLRKELLVRIDCGGGSQEAKTWSQSSIERELQFLVSHTVHHYALAAVMLRLEGRVPVENFGISPSTLNYRGSLR